MQHVLPRPPVAMNDRLTGLECIRCGRSYPVSDQPEGCIRCQRLGTPANLRCTYAADGQLPLAGAITLGEGDTPLFPLPDGLAPDGVDVRVKNEGANPTGSHKDRFSWGAVGRAAAAGYGGVVAASSGNAALSLATYSAAYGLRCSLAVTRGIPRVLADAVRETGAELHVFDSADERWGFVRESAADPQRLAVTNYARPVVGSSPFGIDAMRPLAWEIRSQWQRLPDHVVLPVSRGDLAYGVYLGLRELARGEGAGCPAVHLVEPFARLCAVRAGASVHGTFDGSAPETPSIAGDSTTAQALEVLRGSGGRPVVVDAGVREARLRLARSGVLCEGASATVLPALLDLHATGTIAPGDAVVLVATSHPFKGL